ncbi:gamma-glutamylcyclotransferase-like [Schistocerca piceifrons]|uniref:gamma-glutamylcyclotransferase-like n=1 Tax=Schistocerca piceifrons TaxID=274613 RepID=UPI001F5E9AC9|nr:gamma-glutamylcyclotransferase-like [Schistocerca piceifrons]XP_047117655.1 gamma-glutamylcyclotransferase-like [Schistocerca piceifrons]
MGGKFFYFAYGSNLLAKRIHINNPSAIRISAAKLKDFRLDFGTWAERWRGAVATLVPEQGKHVWGAVWEIDKSNLADLDRQEGVNDGFYFPMQVDVEKLSGEFVNCRSYQLCDTPTKISEGDIIPENRLPSALYLDVVIQGAIESGLPDDYINQLKKIQHNGYEGVGNKLQFLISSQ